MVLFNRKELLLQVGEVHVAAASKVVNSVQITQAAIAKAHKEREHIARAIHPDDDVVGIAPDGLVL